MQRRQVLRTAAAALGASAALPQSNPSVKPFTIKVPAAELNRIMRRVKDTRLPAALDSTDWRYGANSAYLAELIAYWQSKYDWRKAEAQLNRYPQFRTTLSGDKGDSYEIHFQHIKSGAPNAIPIVMTHGWPGSILEFQQVIPLLTGANARPAFDLVIPSLPGFGFSSKPVSKPIGPRTVAVLWHKLMTETLGYRKYGAQGGDWGNAVTVFLAAMYPDSLHGIHLNNTGTNSALPEAEQTDAEKAWVRATAAYRAAELDYFNLQNHKPMTVSFALNDNPVGWLAWMVEKMKSWTDSADHIEKTLTKDQILTNAMIYLVNQAEGTAHWIYRGNAEDGPSPVRGRINVKTAFLSSKAEMTSLNPPRRFLERSFNLVQYNTSAVGGHFIGLEQPALLAEDVRLFFRQFA